MKEGIIAKNKKDFSRLFKSRYFWISVAVLLMGIAINNIVSLHIKAKYGNTLPILGDFVLDKLPYLTEAVWLYDFFSILPIILIIYYAYKADFNKIPYILLLFGLINLTRGFFLGLTPFGVPNQGVIGIFEQTAFREGVYPSGHTGSAFLVFLLVKKWYKPLAFIFLMGTIITLLFGKGHYSIDIFSALLFVYAIYAFGEKYFKKRFTLAK